MINDFLIKISEADVKLDEVKDIQQLKKDSDELEDTEKLVNKFYKLMIKQIKKDTNKDYNFLQEINSIDKKKINSSITKLNKLLILINQKQLINVNLIGLAHYLAELKVTFLTKDGQKAAEIIKRFVDKKSWNLVDLGVEVKMFSNFVKDFQNEHEKFADVLNDSLNEEDFLNLKIDKQNKILKLLNETSIIQKNLIFQIKAVFINLMNQMLKDDSIGEYVDVRSLF
tara:strand:+ start:8005 stop:8685 length:681 start_codon:yes stop_codon:yes gene_type:complete